MRHLLFLDIFSETRLHIDGSLLAFFSYMIHVLYPKNINLIHLATLNL